MGLFKKKPVTPNQALFNAIAKRSVNGIRQAIANGADVNCRTDSGVTPLDHVADCLENSTARITINSLRDLPQLAQVWNELVRQGGKLNVYKDDPGYRGAFTLELSRFGSHMTDISFNAPNR